MSNYTFSSSPPPLDINECEEDEFALYDAADTKVITDDLGEHEMGREKHLRVSDKRFEMNGHDALSLGSVGSSGDRDPEVRSTDTTTSEEKEVPSPSGAAEEKTVESVMPASDFSAEVLSLTRADSDNHSPCAYAGKLSDQREEVVINQGTEKICDKGVAVEDVENTEENPALSTAAQVSSDVPVDSDDDFGDFTDFTDAPSTSLAFQAHSDSLQDSGKSENIAITSEPHIVSSSESAGAFDKLDITEKFERLSGDGRNSAEPGESDGFAMVTKETDNGNDEWDAFGSAAVAQEDESFDGWAAFEHPPEPSGTQVSGFQFNLPFVL